MKKILTFISAVILTASLWAQAPNKMSFQSVVRNNLGKLVVNKSIGVRLSILKTSSTGTAVYVETHTKTSNVNGLVTLEVGTGTVTTGTFSTIDWSQGPYFLKTEMDVNGGTSYSVAGVTEFVSVPYAKMADNAVSAISAISANSVKTVANGANVGDMNYWNGTTWVPLNAGSEGQTLTFCGGKPMWVIGGVCPGTITSLNCSSATNSGTLTASTVANGVSSLISYTGGNGGTHNGQVVTSTGVTGLTATLQAGSFASGNGSVAYTITGTPSAIGTANFALNIGGKTCTLTRNILSVGAIGTLDCASATNSGILTATVVASTVKSVVSYTGGNGGTHNGQEVISTGVTGLTATLQAGTFANGNGSLTYTITGTPTTNGTASFALNIGGKTCILTRNVILPVGTIGTLECATASHIGTLTVAVAASAVPSVISYTGGNGGTHNGQVVNSKGVTGLTATLQAGTFAIGNGNLMYTITGTPATTGTASFTLNIGGKTCTLTRSVVLPVGSISALDCANATNNGTLTVTLAASGVTSVISYTGGNGGTHNGQVITSTGVSGLTATLQAGTFANGNGNLTYTITGTPSTSGTASFVLNIGGKACTLKRILNPTSGYGSNITDVDGNSYKTVFIGAQQWLAENLKTSMYSDGTTIPNITDDYEWSNLNSGAWVYHENDATNNSKYGKLYNWYAVSKTTNGNKNVCPTGWHVPTRNEWNVLTDYLGGDSIAGGKMKEAGTTSWISPNTSSTNSSLFTGLPGAGRNPSGNYSYIGYVGAWWSFTEYDAESAWYLSLVRHDANAFRGYYTKVAGKSVRCLRD